MEQKRIYLSKELKEYYSNSLLIEIENESIDEGIEKHLLRICKSNNFRPLFSKKGRHDIKKTNLQSYLRVAFSQEVEQILDDEIIPYFKEKYSSNDEFEFNYFERFPRTEKGRKITEQNKGAKYLVDPDYFNISYIEFQLDKGDLQTHNEFWKDLEEKLSD